MATFEEQQALLRSTVPLGTPAAADLAVQGYTDVGVPYNPNIPVNKITPTSPIKLPESTTSTDYDAILASLSGSLPEEAVYKKTQEDITAALTEKGGEETFKAEKEKELGLDIDRKALRDLQAQLLAVNTEAEISKLNLDRQGQPTRLTAANILDQQNIEKDRTIKALRLSSSIQAMQGNIDLANDQVKRAVDLKYEPIKNRLEILNKQLEFNYKSFDAAEKKRADALKKANDIKLKEMEIEKDKEESWVKTKNTALADGVPLNIVNSAQQFFDAKQEDKARSLLGSYVKPKKISNEPLSILDIARYNEKYPEAEVVAGDTEAQANAKVIALSAPKEYTDEELRIGARGAKKENLTYEEAIAEIEADPLTANKDRAKLITGEIYGKKPQTAQQTKIENTISQLKKGGILNDGDIRFALKQQGYTTQEINDSSLGTFLTSVDSFVDSLSNFLFK